jgi:hypothetical protein
MSAFFGSDFYTRMKRYWGENTCLPHAETAIYESKVKLFLKGTGYEYDGNIFVACFHCTHVFDLTNLKGEKRRNVGKLNNELNIVNQLVDLHFLLFVNITGN